MNKLAAAGGGLRAAVGLEVHAQLASRSKLFSGAGNSFGGGVNSSVAWLDAGVPGALPALNARCVRLAARAALALACRLHARSSFDRKHYFYADLPLGYQITQQRAPLASDGRLRFQVYTPGIHKKPYTKISKIKQIQLEQDSGKSLHDAELKRSLVDLNRAGAPLIELVFEPDLEDGEEAAALVKELVLIVQRLGVCSGRMEEGALRVDANVSVNRPGEPLGTRTEIKNIGSVRGVAGAIKYEISRQMDVVSAGGIVTNETRSWDAVTRTTVLMRDKEVVQDYRFMPEPNLPPLRLNLTTKEDHPDIISIPLLKDSLPELPEESRQKLTEKHNLKPEIAMQIVNEPILLDYFEQLITVKDREPTKIANILINEYLTVLNKQKIDLEHSKITVKQLGELIDLLNAKIINLEVCRLVMVQMIHSPEISPTKIIEENDWTLVSDDGDIIKICVEVLENNPKLVKQYRDGKLKVFKALLGIIVKNTHNKYDMSLVSRKLEELLKK